MSAVLSPPRITPEDLLLMPDDSASHEPVNGRLEENPTSVKSNLLGGEFYGHIWI